MGCVYIVTNKVNGKQYVGMTRRDPELRRQQHIEQSRAGCQFAFARALRAHGEDAFRWTPVFHVDSVKRLLRMEAIIIRKLGTVAPRGYNLRTGAEPYSSVARESREKMSRSRLRLWERKRSAYREGFLEYAAGSPQWVVLELFSRVLRATPRDELDAMSDSQVDEFIAAFFQCVRRYLQNTLHVDTGSV